MCMGERPLLYGLAAHDEAGEYLDSPATQFRVTRESLLHAVC